MSAYCVNVKIPDVIFVREVKVEVGTDLNIYKFIYDYFLLFLLSFASSLFRIRSINFLLLLLKTKHAMEVFID